MVEVRMSPRRLGRIFFSALVVSVPGLPSAHAIDWLVDIVADENDPACAPLDCSLREAIAAAGDGDTILFALPGFSPHTLTLDPGLGQLVIASDLTISGPGLDELFISGGDAIRVVTIAAGAAASFEELSLEHGRSPGGDKHGGCLKVLGQLQVSAVGIRQCHAWSGGITSNADGGDGGGVYVAAGAVLVGSGFFVEQSEAGHGGGALSPPPSFAGGRGGAIANAGTVDLSLFWFQNNRGGDGGDPQGPGGDGGALANLSGGSLRLDNGTLSSNASGDGAAFFPPAMGADGRGGAIFCAGDCTLNDVTISGNTIGDSTNGNAGTGGGLHVAGGTARLRNVTVAENTANGAGGGIARSAGTIRPRNSLFAQNSGAGSPDCSSATAGVVSEGRNLIRINAGCGNSFTGTDQEGTAAMPLEPLLQPLASNGFPIETHGLGAGSPAIDRGEPTGCLGWNPSGASDFLFTTDARLFPRPTDGDGDTVATCDVGAFEAEAVAPVQHLLTVVATGSGVGAVSSTPAGIQCPGDCDESFVFTQNVQLAATPAAGSYFIGWGGDCSGAGPCGFTMSADRSVTATFGLLRTLVVSIGGIDGGSGSVESDPAGIACPGDCAHEFIDGTEVALTATPAPGSFFAGWSGDCSGAGVCQPALDGDRAVAATFGSLTIFADGFESSDECEWSANVGGGACPP
jgi:CSLREA domain-containing protein